MVEYTVAGLLGVTALKGVEAQVLVDGGQLLKVLLARLVVD